MSPSFEAGAREAMSKTAGIGSAAMGVGRRALSIARPFAPELIGAGAGALFGGLIAPPESTGKWMLGGAVAGGVLGRLRHTKFHSSGQMLP